MGPKYILTYFSVTGRGETARTCFHLAGVEFTDNQLSWEEWTKQKTDGKRFPLGVLPTLEVDGEIIVQSKAINRFLAEEFNLYGSSNWDRVLIDQVSETIGELNDGFSNIKMDQSKDEETKNADIAAYFADDKTKQKFAFLICKLRSKNGSFFLGDKISFADIAHLVSYEYISMCHPAIADAYPELAALYKTTSEVEPIKKYLANRKHHPYL